MRRSVHALRLVAAAAWLTACGPAEKKEIPRVTTAVTTGGGPAPLPSCPGTGHWEACTVFDRLERAGLAPQRGDTIRLPFLRVAGQTWRLGSATIFVFRYRDSTLRHADFVALDSLQARPAGDTATHWTGTPTLLVNDNLLAILLSENEEQVERVSLALTAGPAPKAPPAAPK
ncbi:MAG: hypothetical protein IT355_03835 [Gemmatimonadaceae bacterium]|nr:hypothetical protein [Gemmatimonadaceae bacterium]